MKSFYPVLYLCFLFGLLPFLGSCSEENESSGTIEMINCRALHNLFYLITFRDKLRRK